MLTEREREVLDLIAAGSNNGQIAAELYLAPKTVRNNVSTSSPSCRPPTAPRPSSGPGTPGSARADGPPLGFTV